MYSGAGVAYRGAEVKKRFILELGACMDERVLNFSPSA
jgi:hypothetical protein